MTTIPEGPGWLVERFGDKTTVYPVTVGPSRPPVPPDPRWELMDEFEDIMRGFASTGVPPEAIKRVWDALHEALRDKTPLDPTVLADVVWPGEDAE